MDWKGLWFGRRTRVAWREQSPMDRVSLIPAHLRSGEAASSIVIIFADDYVNSSSGSSGSHIVY